MTDPTPAAEGAAPSEPTPNMNMTGVEAKAYVESLKQKQSQGNAKQSPVKTEKAAPKETPQQIAQEIARKFKVKIDGAEREVDEAELIRGYSHQQAANKALQEGKSLRKQSEELVALLKDPVRFFEIAKQLGHDPRQLSENYLVEILNEESMDPKERENKYLRKELEARKAVEEEKRKLAEMEREHALKEHFAKKYSEEFIPALQEAKLPPTKETIAKMAYYIHQASELKMPMTAQEAAKLVREDIINHQRNILSDIDGDALMELLDPQIAAKIRKHDLAKLKSPEQFLKTPEASSYSRRERKTPNKKMSHKEWREFNRT